MCMVKKKYLPWHTVSLSSSSSVYTFFPLLLSPLVLNFFGSVLWCCFHFYFPFPIISFSHWLCLVILSIFILFRKFCIQFLSIACENPGSIVYSWGIWFRHEILTKKEKFGDIPCQNTCTRIKITKSSVHPIYLAVFAHPNLGNTQFKLKKIERHFIETMGVASTLNCLSSLSKTTELRSKFKSPTYVPNHQPRCCYP